MYRPDLPAPKPYIRRRGLPKTVVKRMTKELFENIAPSVAIGDVITVNHDDRDRHFRIEVKIQIRANEEVTAAMPPPPKDDWKIFGDYLAMELQQMKMHPAVADKTKSKLKSIMKEFQIDDDTEVKETVKVEITEMEKPLDELNSDEEAAIAEEIKVLKIEAGKVLDHETLQFEESFL